jgi:hypothetical protein
MRRFLLLFLVALGLFWWIGRMLKSLRGPTPARRSPDRPGGATADQGPMVRDRVCNTFLPRSRALRLEDGSEEHFFCSETCRDRFLAEKGPSSG